MTLRDEVRQLVSFSWGPRWSVQTLLKSTGFSLSEFSYGFTFSSSLFLFTSLPLPLHHQVALSQCQEGREGDQHFQVPRISLQGYSESSVICSPSLGRLSTSPLRCAQPPPTEGLGRVQLRWELQGCAWVRRQSWGCAADNPISSRLSISWALNEISDFRYV